MTMNLHNDHRGSVMFQVLVFGAIALLFVGGLIAWASSNIRYGHNLYSREVALDIAEAGIEYYRWHLAHSPVDYTDGTGAPGPYVHPYNDINGKKIGRFELTIVPPLIGSTIVTVKSTGYLDAAPLVKRTLQTVLAKSTFAKYAVVANADMRFGGGTNIFGLVHSNGGIHFDGFTHNVMTSAKSEYTDPDHSGPPEFGVHTHNPPVDPVPPAAVPSRIDVFAVGRTFPVPAVDFTGITADLAGIKTDAQAAGIYLASSGRLGYHIVVKTNDTMDIYRVTSTVPAPSGCTNTQNQYGWGTWSIQNQNFLYNKPFPANAAIFVEDNLWIDGTINGARLMFASGKFPEDPATDTSITVNANLKYTNFDGTDVIGLLAQGNINIGMVSATILEIDAALIAKNGRVGRYYYQGASGGQNHCSPYDNRNTLTLYGMIITNQRYGFAYTGTSGGTGLGYAIRHINYDANLLYSPPPYFPLTASQYIILSWKEL